MNNMNPNIKLEVAVEILATKIAMHSMKGYNVEDEEMKKMIKEREEMYKGNEIIIDKIIKEYGTEVKRRYEQV